MQNASVKKEAYRLVEDLPEDATWDDLMYKIYVRQAIEAGIRDAEAGRVVDLREARTRISENLDERVEFKGDGDLETWSDEMEQLARQIPQEDFRRIDTALAEADEAAKAWVRRQMGLA